MKRLTERLVLYPIEPKHAGDLWTLHQDPRVAAWHGPHWSRHEYAEAFANRTHHAWETVGVGKWIAYDRVTNELVGRGGLSRMTLEENLWAKDIGLVGSLEVGWTVRSDLWGKGYASEIGRAGLDFAFNELEADQVVAFTDTPNVRSRAVMERLGMRFVQDLEDENGPFVLYLVQSAGSTS